MRVQRGRHGLAQLALCACAVAAASAPWPGQAQSMQFGAQAGAEAEVDSERGASAQAGGEADLALEPGAAEDGESGSEAGGSDAAAAGPTHTVVEGDTLWGVSERYYQDPYAWPRLWSYNPQITNPHYIYPGDVLVLGGDGVKAGARVGVVRGKVGPSRRVLSAMPPQTVILREHAYLDEHALEQAGRIMGSKASHMLLSVSDEAYVEFEEHPRAPVGREMIVYRRYTAEENSPVAADPYVYDPENPGAMVKVVGALEVLSYDPETKVARTEIVEAIDTIERGFRVADEPRRFLTVKPKTNQRTVESKVVAAADPVQLVGQHQLVYLDVGAQQGVQTGNRFFVIRQGDAWRKGLPAPDEAAMGAVRPRKDFPPQSKYPEEVIAELLVLHTRPETTTAVVTHAVREVVPGDLVRMQDGY